jgi:NTE family protein
LSAGAKVSGMQALILSGGGAQAAYEIGVMGALFTGLSPATGYRQLNPGVLVGTSAGSINAGLLLSALGDGPSAAIKYVEQVWKQDLADSSGNCGGGPYRLRGSPLAFVHPGCVLDPMGIAADIAADGAALVQSAWLSGIGFVMSKGSFEDKVLQVVDLSALISTEKFAELLREKILLHEIQRSPWEVKVAATNWRTGKVRIFDKTTMTDEIGHRIFLASSALPGVVPPVEIDGDPYVDGGIVMNTPLKPAIEAGADTLHVIHMDPDISRIPLSRVPSTVAVLSRSLEIRFRTSIMEDVQTARSINHSIAALSGRALRPGEAPLKTATLLQEAGKRLTMSDQEPARRPLTIHLHYPPASLNVGWLSFARDNIERLICRGYEDAKDHDCRANHCVFPVT